MSVPSGGNGFYLAVCDEAG